MKRSHLPSRDRSAAAVSSDSASLATAGAGSSRQRASSRSDRERERDRDREMRVSRARSVAALNRVQEVEVQNSQLQRYKESAREKAAELELCKQQLSEKDLQVRDLKYEVAKLKRERVAQEEQRKETDARHRASILALRTGLETLEQSVKDKHAYLTQESKHMLEMVETLLRHTMNGFHAGPTRTTSELLNTLQSRLSTMYETLRVDQMSSSYPVQLQSGTSEQEAVQPAEGRKPAKLPQRSASSASMKSRTASSSQARHGGAATAASAAATAAAGGRRRPTDLGRSASAEASIATQQPTSRQAQLNAIKADPAMAKLINQYRSVILKEREQSTSLKAELEQEKTCNAQLKAEVEQLKADLREVFHDRKIDHGRLIAAEADKAKLMMMFESVVGTEEVQARKTAFRQRQKKPYRRRSRDLRASTPDEESSYGPGVTSEEAAEEDLRMLDDQIGRLKMQLERAALDHTNEIMSKVVQCAGSGQQHIATST